MPYFKKHILFLLLATTYLASCKSGGEEKKAEETTASTGTPVTVTTINTDPLTEYIELNATSTFLQKSYVKANVNGYVQTANTQPGKYVTAGQTLFVIKTKEAQNIGNAVNNIDPSFRFSGVNNIKANTTGYITQLNHQVGDYVQDGEQLAVISDASSFAFLLNLPFELRSYLNNKKTVELLLPDGTKLTGTIAATMPSVDPASQTQSIVIKVPANNIPENLIAKVKLVKSQKADVVAVPKSAILTNDIQSDYWVMKMIDSNTAVKVVIKKGLETKDMVAIDSPTFAPTDRILVTGNYGLPDTAKVKIEQ